MAKKKQKLVPIPKYRNRHMTDRNMWNFKQLDTVSQTQPNGAYTVKELIRRFEQGIIDPIAQPVVDFEATSFDQPDLQELHGADLNEKHDFLEQHYATKRDLEQLHKEQESKKKEDFELKIQERVQKKINAEAEKRISEQSANLSG